MTGLLARSMRPVPLPHWTADLLLAIPRIICGFLLTTQFGAPKFGLPWSPRDNNLGLFEVAYWFPYDVQAFGGIFALAPEFFAWMGAFSEGVGGILMVLGLQTRLTGFLVVATMLVAIFGQQFQNGMWSMLPATGFLWVGLYCMVLGSGRFGFDALLSARKAR